MIKDNSFSSNDSSLESLANEISRDYYDIIDLMISQIGKRAESIRKNRISDTAFIYLSLCDQLLDELKQYIFHRKQNFMPYVEQLAEKNGAGHNCDNCSGKCSMEHGVRLVDFTTSLQQIKKIIHDIKAALLQQYKNDDNLILLHEEIISLDKIVTELLYREESQLLVKIRDAQRNIHANE